MPSATRVAFIWRDNLTDEAFYRVGYLRGSTTFC